MRLARLPETTVEELNPVLVEEAACWQAELCWDYRSAMDLIRRAQRSRSLQGHVLRVRGNEVVGYVYHVMDREVGYIGNLYVRRAHASEPAYDLLLEATVGALRTGGALRIECQVVPFNCGLDNAFVRRGFVSIKRRFLLRPLTQGEASPDFRSGYRIQPWSPRFVSAAAEVIYDSYRNSRDFGLCSDYQSLAGCIRFLRNLIDSAGCGKFRPASSLLAFDGEGAATGVLLATSIAPETGMIPQISVKRAAQGRGLGTLLLRTYFSKAFNEGLSRTLLCVSDRNEGALRLYRKLGFQEKKEFRAFIWRVAEDGPA